MELGGVHGDEHRSTSSTGASDNSQYATTVGNPSSEGDDDTLHLLAGSGTLSEDGRTQPLLKVSTKEYGRSWPTTSCAI